jgi:translation initiation factor 3 subunit D
LTPGDLGTETTAGQIRGFDTAWDRVRYNKPKKIPAFKGEQGNKLIIQDPIIQQLAQDGKAQIFASDTAAAALMTSCKAQYPWDLSIKKFSTDESTFLFIDKREEENMLDWQTVSETASIEFQPFDEDGVNGVRQLMIEAARASTNYLSAVQSQTLQPKVMDEEDPYLEDED